MTTNIVWNRDSSNDILPNPSPSQNLYAWAGDGSGENYTRSAADDIIVTPELPEHLYGWTDYHRTGTQLYKWVESGVSLYGWTSASPSTSTEAELPITFYTTTPNPTTSSTLYDSEGNDITSQVLWGSSSLSEATSDHITWFIAGPI